MATFDAQISAQVAQDQKDRIKSVLAADQGIGAASEADVIREAIAMGLEKLGRETPAKRIEKYARRRRGLV